MSGNEQLAIKDLLLVIQEEDCWMAVNKPSIDAPYVLGLTAPEALKLMGQLHSAVMKTLAQQVRNLASRLSN